MCVCADGPPQRLVDIELFKEVRRVEDALRNRSCTEALAWCNENKLVLRKAKVCARMSG